MSVGAYGLGLLIQVEDSLSTKVPSFTDRFNFTLPLIVILFIIMFFLLLKSDSFKSTISGKNSLREKKTGKN